MGRKIVCEKSQLKKLYFKRGLSEEAAANLEGDGYGTTGLRLRLEEQVGAWLRKGEWMEPPSIKYMDTQFYGIRIKGNKQKISR